MNLKEICTLIKQQVKQEVAQEIMLNAHPVGSYWITESEDNPAELWGGAWTKVEGKFLLGSSQTYALGTEGGEATHTLTEAEAPTHTHTRGTMDITGAVGGGGQDYNTKLEGAFYQNGRYQNNADSGNTNAWVGEFQASRAWTGATSASGGGQAHNNMPPYRTVHIWKRIE